MTVLHWASAHGHLPTVLALILAGASLNIQTNERWAFCVGAAGAASGDSGATVACRNTPLHLAAANVHADVAAALINAGADVKIKNVNGWAFCGGAAGAADGPVPPLRPPLPAGIRRCIVLPTVAMPPQRPLSSTPART